MKPFPITLILGFLLTFSAYAKLPKVESLKPDESLTVEREMSEPRINRYEFIFTQGSVSITYNKKKLGVLKITKADAQMIDQFLYSVKRGRKSGRRHLGTPVYTIVSKKAEEKASKRAFFAFQNEISKAF